MTIKCALKISDEKKLILPGVLLLFPLIFISPLLADPPADRSAREPVQAEKKAELAEAPPEVLPADVTSDDSTSTSWLKGQTLKTAQKEITPELKTLDDGLAEKLNLLTPPEAPGLEEPELLVEPLHSTDIYLISKENSDNLFSESSPVSFYEPLSVPERQLSLGTPLIFGGEKIGWKTFREGNIKLFSLDFTASGADSSTQSSLPSDEI